MALSPHASALRRFAGLPWPERWFVRARLATAPLDAVAARTPTGKVADIGCGHGALVALLAEDPRRRVLGVDPDSRKLHWARLALGGRSNVELVEGTAATLGPARAGSFDAVSVADVLYLVPFPQWRAFLQGCLQLLRPGGVLLLKEAEDDGSWRARKTRWQEEAMVRMLRRTRSSGGLGFFPREALLGACTEAGFEVESAVDLSRGYTTPHVLITARAGAAQAVRASGSAGGAAVDARVPRTA